MPNKLIPALIANFMHCKRDSDTMIFGRFVPPELTALKPEKEPTRHLEKMPNGVQYPAQSLMEPVYSSRDGLKWYAVQPQIDMKNEEWLTRMSHSALYYTICEFDAKTGRRLRDIYRSWDEKEVESRFKEYVSEEQLTRKKEPYCLYELRVKHGYGY